MKIYGLRVYPQSIEVAGSKSTPIYIHGRVSEECSDFFYTFSPMAPLWRDHLFAETFGVSYNDELELEDPMPALREQYGSSLVDAELDGQLMLLKGDDFADWGKTMYFCEGAFLPIFRERPPFELLRQLYWDVDFSLTSETWPRGLRSVLHMWDDIYWQLFTTVRADLDFLIRAHLGDPKLKMYFVDLDREYPNPSNQKLERATLKTRPDVGKE